jgi:hypothetical protein
MNTTTLAHFLYPLRPLLFALLLSAGLPHSPAFAQQPPGLNFSVSLGTNVAVRSVALDGSGNAYITGNFFGTVDFDPSASTAPGAVRAV